MKKILFVDDEQRILEGLQRLLRGQRGSWEMVFSPSGPAALLEMEKSRFDMIVTDMIMPGMDGGQLLEEVHKRYPGMVRIVLSGCTDREGVIRAIPVAHQFLAKPCDPEVLKEVVDRAFNLQVLLRSAALRSAVGSVIDLPSLPHLYTSMMAALANPNTSLQQVATIVEQDVALCAKMLQLVNSAFFAPVRKVTDIKSAVSLLGINLLKNLALSLEVFRKFEGSIRIPGFSLQGLQDHSILTASIARRLLSDKEQGDHACIAGMLHDVGKLVLAAQSLERFAKALASALERGCPLYRAEEDAYDEAVTHAQVGAYLLGLWGLPYPIVEAVCFHHRPDRARSSSFDTLAAVHVANVLAHEADDPKTRNAPWGDLEMDFLARLGVTDRLPAWREIAAQFGRNSRRPLPG